MTSAPVYSPSPETLIRLDIGSARRAHRTYLQLKKQGHPAFAEEAAALRDQALRNARSLARANGWDQPVSARGAHDPKTPASGEGASRVAAAGGNAGVDSTSLTLRGPREAIV